MSASPLLAKASPSISFPLSIYPRPLHAARQTRSATAPIPPSPARRRDDLDRLARLDLGLPAAGQDFDASVVAADGIAAEFAFAPAHHPGVGNRAMTAQDRSIHRPKKADAS